MDFFAHEKLMVYEGVADCEFFAHENPSVYFQTACFLPSLSSTLSNWVLEFDRWAPSVAKIPYKVSSDTAS